jgi:hypothetical protein
VSAEEKELLLIGEMRPGSLTKQYRQPKEKKGGFYQIRYTYKMKSKTEYVRPQHFDDLKQQVETYQKFKNLIEKWIDLALEHSKLKIQSFRNRKRGSSCNGNGAKGLSYPVLFDCQPAMEGTVG